MGLIVNGRVESVPGLTCTSWQDDARLRLKMGEDGRKRPSGSWRVRGIVLHTTRGLPLSLAANPPPRILPGKGPATNIERDVNHWWSIDARNAGAHLIVDYDASVACLADLLLEETYHAGPVNPVTVGIEIAQRADLCLFEEQLEGVVALVDWLTDKFQIQRQIPRRGVTYYKQGMIIPRCAAGGRDVVGVYGHRDVTLQRGWGDPGDAVFAALERSGYEAVDFAASEDRDLWRTRQAALGMAAVDQDGIPGPRTAAAIAAWQLSVGREATGVLAADERDMLSGV